MEDSKIIFGDMLNHFRKEKGWTMEELGEKMGKTKSAVSRWVSGNNYPKVDDIEKLTKLFDTDVETLIFGGNIEQTDDSPILSIYNQLHEPRQKRVYNYAKDQLREQNLPDNVEEFPVHYTTVRCYGSVSAGTGVFLQDEEYEEVQVAGDVPEHDFAVKVNGDSMEPMLQDGELIYVHKTSEARSGQIIIADLNGDAFVKKLYKNDQEVKLISLNQKYDDIVLRENDEFIVFGVVVLKGYKI